MCCADAQRHLLLSRSSAFVVNDFAAGYNQRMGDGPNQTIYGPLALERYVKDDGRKLIVYTLRPGAEASASGASTSASATSTSASA
jgi:hypothetical protein